MAPFFLLGQLLHVPVWLIERLWLSLLVAVGFTGMVRLATALRIGSRRLPAAGRRRLRAVADVHDRDRIHVGRGPAGPGRAVGRAAARQRRCRGAGRSSPGCARSGLAVALMGGVNAVSTICRPGAAGAVHPDAHAADGSASSSACCGRGGRRGYRVVGRTAAAAGPLLVQLPAVHRAGERPRPKTMSADSVPARHRHLDRLPRPRRPRGCRRAGTMVSSPGRDRRVGRSPRPSGWPAWPAGTCPSAVAAASASGLAAVIALAGYYGPLGGPLHGLVREPCSTGRSPRSATSTSSSRSSPWRSRSAARTRCSRCRRRALPIGRSAIRPRGAAIGWRRWSRCAWPASRCRS